MAIYVEENPDREYLANLSRPAYVPATGRLIFDQAQKKGLPLVPERRHTHSVIRVTEQMCGPEIARELGCAPWATSEGETPFLVGVGGKGEMPCCYRAWMTTREEVRRYVTDLLELRYLPVDNRL